MTVSTQDVLLSLFNPEDTVCFRVFDDRKGGVFAGAKLEMEAGKYSAIEKALKSHNEQNRGVFFVVNYGGQDDNSISRINAQFVEMDDSTFEEQQKAVDEFPLPPSMVIKTRKSLHVYWFMRQAKLELFRPIQKQLVAHFSGDPMCVNESRVMRLPGFNHCKKEPLMVECISFHPERKYTQEQLMEVLPIMDEQPVEEKTGDEKGIELLLYGCDFIKHCKNNAKTLSEHDWYAMISNLAPFEGGTKLIHELSAPYPGYTKEATQDKINHFFKSNTKPMTCRTIADKGFKCPKMESGECTCKAPAAMCYQPLNIDGLREIISNLNVTEDTVRDIEDTILPHNPEYYSTVRLGVTYDKKADCPLFKKFLQESMGGDMEQVALIQEMLGYFLIPVNSAQKCFVIVGVGGAGKSVLLRVLNDILLGKQNVSNVSWQSLNERFKTAELFGKLANIFADLPTKNIDDNGIFKALVGEDYITVEKKNKNPFSFQSSARMLFSCNSIPKNYGDRSEGFYRRLIIMRFNNAVSPEKRDPELINKFRMEADGIFLFALEGLKRLMKNNYVFSETEVNRAELQQYREDSDSVLSFVKENCEINAKYHVSSTELFNAYKNYCEECGLKPYSQKMFVQQITASYPEVTRGVDTLGKRRILNGIKISELCD